MRCHFGFNNFIFPRKTKQRIRQLLPFSYSEIETEKKPVANSALGNFIGLFYA